MAEEISLHSQIGRDEKGQYCAGCNHRYGYAAQRGLNLQACEHVATQLTAAGFGLVADAWDEGQKSGMRHADRVIAAHKIGRPELPGPPSPNPYRKASNDDH